MKFLRKFILNKNIKLFLLLVIKFYVFFIGYFLYNFSKKYASIHSRILKLSKWSLAEKSPSYYDHEINLYNWIYNPTLTQFVESGIFARKIIKKNSNVLDLCCGNGFYTYLFLSELAKTVDAIDLNLESNRKSFNLYKRKNINFINGDIINYDFKKKNYDTVIWLEGVAYFSNIERIKIYKKIQDCLKNNGILYIRTPLEFDYNNSANQKNVVTNQELFEEGFREFFNIKSKNLSEYRNRSYLNYYLTTKEK